jgi:CO/xanthine dehydrogenase Mo-binding subunit
MKAGGRSPAREGVSEVAASGAREGHAAAWGTTTVVGAAVPRVDGWERVTGTAVYPLDLQLPGMLYAAVLRCPHAHARVQRIDTSRAEGMPGVRAVLTGASPGADVPWFPQRGKGPLSKLFDPHCRYAGEEVAAVAATTVFQAREALAAIAVEYEVLPFVAEMEQALLPGAPSIHEGGNRQNETLRYQRGDVAKGFSEADAVVELSFQTACEIHTPMEVHGSVARWEGDTLTVWDTTQGVFAVRDALASALGLPLANVRVICPYMGGGFGSKLGLNKHTVIAALLARATARPVKLFLSREETFLCVGNRPPTRLTIKAGAKKDGTLVALEMKALGTGGAYPYLPTSGYLVADLYTCPNVAVEQDNVFINAGPGRPFRAPGYPPCSWALEQTIDALAEKLGMDPVELRLKNVPVVSQQRGGVPYTSTGLADCLRRGAEAFSWQAARGRARGKGHLRRGVGVAAGMWGYDGEPRATAFVSLFADGSAILNTGASDIGTGTKTVLAQVVAEELGIAPESVRIEHADTGTTQYAPASGGSQTVVANAPAVRAAAQEVRRELLEMAAAELGRPQTELRLAGGAVVTPEGTVHPFGSLKALVARQPLVGVGRRHPHPEGKVALPFVAQFAEVEVNTRTGEVRVLRMLGAQDSGRVMNQLTFENQVFGGIVMGVGFALTEARVVDRQTGTVVNANWHDYKIPTMKDCPPELTCLPVDPQDRECNTVGAKGLGEPATIPTAAAIANAVYHAVGIRVTTTPASPVQMAALLERHRQEG